MKLKFIGKILLFAAIATSAFAEDICGIIDLPTTWTKENSPYRITGDIQISPASRLIIEAGVEVHIVPGETCGETKQLDWADSNYVSIKAYGPILIKGTAEEPVRILPEKHQNGKIQWDGIRLPLKTKAGASIEYLHIMGANKAINAHQGRFNIGNSLFKSNGTGIWLENEGDISVYNSVFTENISSGIYVRNSRPSIAANIFYRNSSFGILADSRQNVRIQNNLFWQNADTDCRFCPVGVSPSKDKFGNLYTDPIFAGSAKEAELAEKDESLKTPEKELKDVSLQKTYEKSLGRADTLRAATQPYFPSKYSPLKHAAPETGFFKNADGTRGDIGIYGGTPGRTDKTISF